MEGASFKTHKKGFNRIVSSLELILDGPLMQYFNVVIVVLPFWDKSAVFNPSEIGSINPRAAQLFVDPPRVLLQASCIRGLS